MSSRPDYRELETWLRENGGRLLRRAYFHTRDKKLAEQIAQDAAVKVHKAWDDPEKRELILNKPGYVSSIVRNCFLDCIAASSRTSNREVEFDAERHDQAVSSSEEHEEHTVLHSAINRLTAAEQDLIFLHYFEDLKIKDAAEQLGVPASRAYRLHDSAKAHLRELLTEDEGEA